MSAPLLAGVLKSRALQQPQDIAFRFLEDGEHESRVLTYQALHAEARRVAALLRGVAARGDRVMLVYAPGPDFVVAFHACLLAGLVAVPCPPPGARSRATGRLTAIAGDAQASVLATSAALAPLLGAVGENSPAWRCVVTDSPGPVPVQDTADDGEPGPGELAFLQYTSGSTGQPKGVMVTHGQLAANLESLRVTIDLGPQDVSVTWLPSFHDMGLIDGVLEPVYAGYPGIIMPPVAFLMRPLRWLQAISRYRGTHGGGPSFCYDLLLQRLQPHDLQGLDLSCWRSAYNGAEPVRADVIERFSAAFAPVGFRPSSMMPCYGMAEATLMVSCSPVDQAPLVLACDPAALEHGRLQPAGPQAASVRRLVGCGPVGRGTEVVIADPDTGAELPAGAVGEIWVQGLAVASGYWRQPEATQATFGARLRDGRGPFMRTGDLGTRHEGHVVVTGRLKDLVILQGRNHYPQDLEATAEAAHPALRSSNSAAFSVDGPAGEDLVLVMEIERAARHGLDVEDVAAIVRGAVASAHDAVVECVCLIPPGALPKTSSGKIQRRKCRQSWIEGSLRPLGESRRRAAAAPSPQPVAAEPPPQWQAHPDGPVTQMSALLDLLVARAGAVLGVRPELIDPAQPLSLAGLDSLRAVTLAADIGRELGRAVPPTLIYDHPSLAQLARALVAQPGGPATGGPPGIAGAALRNGTSAAVPRVMEPVAVIGIGCRFPGARGPQAFWSLLAEGTDAVQPAAPARWSVRTLQDRGLAGLQAGLMDRIDTLDEPFFGLSAAEARAMDPQQRLLLEVSWEALEHAQVPAARLAGAPVGVFVGISAQDWSRVRATRQDQAGLFTGTGAALSIAANRLSYFYDFRGPSVAVDTACSSSLTAVHLACQAIETGDCDTALVGGVNVLLDPGISEAFSRAGMLSAGGRCRTFDASADGYVRGEGCAVVVLKRLSRAHAEGDRVLAVLRGTAVNQDGRSQGLTAPNGRAQEAVIRAALARAGATPAEVSYVEVHGTGTSLGDPIEAQALDRVLGTGRPAGSPCWVGSVKTNLGHLEAAAGLAGLVKTVLCLHQQRLVPHLHLRQLNPLVPMGPGRALHVVTHTMDWPASGPRLAGVSSFGFGGANAHVVLGEAPPPELQPSPPAGAAATAGSLPLLLSAASADALQAQALRWAGHLSGPPGPVPVPAWSRACAAAAHGRSHLGHRLLAWADGGAEGAVHGPEALRDWAQGRPAPQVFSGRVRRARTAWLFTGQGASWSGMGRDLLAEPEFARALQEVAPWVEPALPAPLVSLLTEAGHAALLPTSVAQPLLFAYGWALAAWWRAQGQAPSLVLGHSLGEITAAAVAGLITLPSAAAFVVRRGRAMQALTGGMVAARAGAARVQELLGHHRGGLPTSGGMAADNGPCETVLAGSADYLAGACALLQEHGVGCRPLASPHAFHSPAVEALLPELAQAAQALVFQAPSVPLLTCGAGADPGRAGYWVQQARHPVMFRTALEQAAARGVDTWLEIGPRPVLAGLVGQMLEARPPTDGPEQVVVCSMRPPAGDTRVPPHLQALGALWTCGAVPDESLIRRAPDRCPREDLPTYAFEPRSHGPESPDLQTPARPDPAPLVIPRWTAAPPANPAPRHPGEPWLLLGPPSRLRRALAAALEDSGCRVTMLDGLPLHDGSQPLKEALRAAPDAAGVVLLALPPHPEPDAPGDRMDDRALAHAPAQDSGPATHRNCDRDRDRQRAVSVYQQALHAAQALIETGAPAAPRLHVVTQAALATADDDRVSDPSGAAAWGLMRTLAHEHPAVAGTLVDIDGADADPGPQACALAALLRTSAHSPARQWARRSQAWLRFDPHVQPLADALRPAGHGPGPMDWRSTGVLLTGGTGGVAAALARELAQRGARYLWLASRTQGDPASFEPLQRELAELGAQARWIRADMADAADVRHLVAQVLEGPGTLTDVIHAAGVASDAPLAEQTTARFERVIGAKLQGAWHLHDALAGHPWRTFLVCGSAAALAGSAGQAPYAAANAAVAAWTQAWRRPGRRVATIAWGPWRDTGLAASPAVQRVLAAQGVRLLEPADAVAGLFAALDLGLTEVGQYHPLPQADDTADPGPPAPVRWPGWDEPTPHGRRRALMARIRAEAAAVLGRADAGGVDPQRGFFDLGFDSLLLMKFKQRLERGLGMQLPATVAFEHPCLSDLAAYLDEEFARSTGATTTASASAARPAAAPEPSPPPGEPPQAPREQDALTRELAAIEKLLA